MAEVIIVNHGNLINIACVGVFTFEIKIGFFVSTSTIKKA